MQDLRNRLYEHLQSMSLRFFTGDAHRRPPVAAPERRRRRPERRHEHGLVDALEHRRSCSARVVAMLWLSWQLTLLALCVVPLFAFLTWRVGRARRRDLEGDAGVARRAVRADRGDAVGVRRAADEGVRPPQRRGRALPGREPAAGAAPGAPADGRAARSSRSCRCSSRSRRRSSTSSPATRT